MQLCTKWGVTSRLKPGMPPAMNIIPQRLDPRDASESRQGGARYTITEKICSDAIIKGNIVMIINAHFEGQRMPKYVATLSLRVFYGNDEASPTLYIDHSEF